MGFVIDQTSRLEVDERCCLYKPAQKELGNRVLGALLKAFCIEAIKQQCNDHLAPGKGTELVLLLYNALLCCFEQWQQLAWQTAQGGVDFWHREVPEALPDAGGEKRFRGLGANGHHKPWLSSPSWTRQPLLADTSEKSWEAESYFHDKSNLGCFLSPPLQHLLSPALLNFTSPSEHLSPSCHPVCWNNPVLRGRKKPTHACTPSSG